MDQDLKDHLDANFARIDERFVSVDRRFGDVEQRIEKVETNLSAPFTAGRGRWRFASTA
jgi:hypothetical protein